METSLRGGRNILGTLARVVGVLTLALMIVDGVLSVAMGSRWLEMQRKNSPRQYARISAALQQLPDPLFRALGGAQAIAAAAGPIKIK